MVIREATPQDIPSIIDFQLKMALETEHITLDIGSLSQGLHRVFKDPSKGRYYVAQEDIEIVGCLMTTYEWSDWRNGTVLWIQSVYIAEEHRGKGVYRRMYAHVQELVKSDSSLKGIRLYVDTSNKNAQTVYQQLGMNGDHYRVYEWMRDGRQ
jgi:L-amino acid N-acyltransferase YncA